MDLFQFSYYLPYPMFRSHICFLDVKPSVLLYLILTPKICLNFFSERTTRGYCAPDNGTPTPFPGFY